MTTIERPAPLDLTKLHTPAEIRQHKAEEAAYFESIRAAEERDRLKDEAAKASANRILSSDEYFDLALEREAERQAQAAKREAERQAEQEATEAYLASLPDIAEVSERNEYMLLLRLQHWMQKGYTVFPDSVEIFMPGFYMVKLKKPATTKKAK